jgi:2'-5' RNA ligase
MSGNWFIALPVPAGAWFTSLAAPPGVRLFGPQDLHLTVAFLGPVAEARARAAFELADGFPLAARQVQLGAVKPLGNERHPSAFSALLSEGRTEVEHALAETRAALWERAGARVDTRPPLAHVTLARPERRADAAQRTAALRWASALELGAPSCALTRIALYTWSLDRRASLFRIVSEAPLPAA